MSIQLVQLRSGMTWTEPRITAPTIRDLFSNPLSYLESVPESERYNLFYTVHECDDQSSRPRQFIRTNTLVFDIDNIIPGREQDYIQVTVSVLGIPHGEQVGWVSSGNGLHCIICLDDYVTDASYFRLHREQYKRICDNLTEAFSEQRLCYIDDLTGRTIGKPDPSVFDQGRVLRMPGTINKKEGRPDTKCCLISGAMSQLSFNWETVSGIPDGQLGDEFSAKNPESVSEEFTKVFGLPDTDAVLNGCAFLKHCKKDQVNLPEPEWHKMVNIVARLEDGHKLVHEYSKEHPKYSAVETNKKIQQVLAKSGPYLCSTINQTWGKCHECENFNKVITPIQIVGADFIKTAISGFHSLDNSGKPKHPCYEDLRRHFEQKHYYITLHGAEQVNIWNGKYWKPIYKTHLHEFAEQKFITYKAKSNLCTEFEKLVKRTNFKETDYLVKSSECKINFSNGTLDLRTDQFTEHRPEYGMTSVLPYEYDPNATCPLFEKFLLDVTGNDLIETDLLIEFAGYCFSGDEYWRHNVLFLLGEGRNGKSLFIKILQACVGDDYYSAVSLNDLNDEQQRALLVNKLFNVCEETPEEGMLGAGSILNALSSGAMMTTKVVFEKPLNVRNKTKFIIISNYMPKIKGIGKAALDRLLIGTFNQDFSEASGRQDPFLFEKMIPELPGIMNMAIAGYKRMKARGHFIRSERSKGQTEELLKDNDNILMFVNECLKIEAFDEKDYSGDFQADIYKSYKNWCLDNSYKPYGANKFWNRLRSKYIKNTEDRITQLRTDNQKRKVRGVYLLKENSFEAF